MNNEEIEQLKRMVDSYIYNLTKTPNTANPKEIELANLVRNKINQTNFNKKPVEQKPTCTYRNHFSDIEDYGRCRKCRAGFSFI